MINHKLKTCSVGVMDNIIILAKSKLSDIFQVICPMSRPSDVVIHYLASLFVCQEHKQTLMACLRGELKS